MPIYQYRCQQCHHEIEVLQKIEAPPPSHCDACGGTQLERCVTAPRFRLAGKGYYETDEKPQAKQRYIASSEEKGKQTAGKEE